MLPTIMDVAAIAMSAFSPSKTCRVRVSSTRYRNDPYRARVCPSLFAPQAVVRAASAVEVVAPISRVAPAPMNWSKLLPSAAASAPTAAPSPVAPTVAVPLVAVPTRAAVPKQHFALIGFKHETAMYQAPFRVAVGDVVVVEADRGEHIGVVQEITTVVPKYNVPSRVLRHATSQEVHGVDDLTIKEKATTAGIQKLAESLGLGIRVVDTEFQMDNNKLTVFFSSKVFVDFRKLQRSLFREYRCRIWLVNWAEVRPYTPVPVNTAV